MDEIKILVFVETVNQVIEGNSLKMDLTKAKTVAMMDLLNIKILEVEDFIELGFRLVKTLESIAIDSIIQAY
jgi:hypothetical protein